MLLRLSTVAPLQSGEETGPRTLYPYMPQDPVSAVALTAQPHRDVLRRSSLVDPLAVDVRLEDGHLADRVVKAPAVPRVVLWPEEEIGIASQRSKVLCKGYLQATTVCGERSEGGGEGYGRASSPHRIGFGLEFG